MWSYGMHVVNEECQYYAWGDYVNRQENEQQNQKKDQNEYNSITQKKKPENQNQTHNVRKEGIQPINQKR